MASTTALTVAPTAFVREVLLPGNAARQPRLDAAACRFPLRVQRSLVHGWGLFAAAALPARRRIIEYTGQRIGAEEAMRRRLRPLLFVVRLDDEHFIDGGIGGSGAELANHGCAPNLVARRSGGRVFLVSTRRIDAGEELLWNYQRAGADAWRCRCGATGCRSVS